jgi:hypothetical protein
MAKPSQIILSLRSRPAPLVNDCGGRREAYVRDASDALSAATPKSAFVGKRNFCSSTKASSTAPGVHPNAF